MHHAVSVRSAKKRDRLIEGRWKTHVTAKMSRKHDAKYTSFIRDSEPPEKTVRVRGQRLGVRV